jgi:hypothetical protein
LIPLDNGARLVRVRRLLQILVPALLVLVPSAALAAAGSSSQVWVTNCTHAQFKPNTLLLACADGSTYLSRVKWSTWTGSSATGKATENENTCDPSCVNSHFERYAVTLKLSNPKGCHKQKHKVFNELQLTYTGKHTSQTPKTLKLTLGCPY